MKIRNYIGRLSFKELKEIFDNFEELEKKGAIGDCLLRLLAEEIVDGIGIEHPPIVLWMNMIANDCYRLVAEKAMEAGFKIKEEEIEEEILDDEEDEICIGLPKGIYCMECNEDTDLTFQYSYANGDEYKCGNCKNVFVW